MPAATLTRFVLGPFADAKRFVTGSLRVAPSTRKRAEEEVEAARAVLASAGCDLSRCTVNNLHTAGVALPATALFDLLIQWRLWPVSAFFACATQDEAGGEWLTYRFYKTAPIVVMRLRTAAPEAIIYDIVSGIGAGGYHAFLLHPVEVTTTTVSILTTFPPTRLFFEGLHDQMNRDIFGELQAYAAAPER